jgi:hypothetical protein
MRILSTPLHHQRLHYFQLYHPNAHVRLLCQHRQRLRYFLLLEAKHLSMLLALLQKLQRHPLFRLVLR